MARPTSILVRKEDRRPASIRLSDDEESTVTHLVRRDDARAVVNRSSIRLLIFWCHIGETN